MGIFSRWSQEKEDENGGSMRMTSNLQGPDDWETGIERLEGVGEAGSAAVGGLGRALALEGDFTGEGEFCNWD